MWQTEHQCQRQTWFAERMRKVKCRFRGQRGQRHNSWYAQHIRTAMHRLGADAARSQGHVQISWQGLSHGHAQIEWQASTFARPSDQVLLS